MVVKNDAKTVPPNKFGFTEYAEKLNGRMAMMGIVALIIIEVATGRDILSLFGL
jgi:hypothetical protein